MYTIEKIGATHMRVAKQAPGGGIATSVTLPAAMLEIVELEGTSVLFRNAGNGREYFGKSIEADDLLDAVSGIPFGSVDTFVNWLTTALAAPITGGGGGTVTNFSVTAGPNDGEITFVWTAEDVPPGAQVLFACYCPLLPDFGWQVNFIPQPMDAGTFTWSASRGAFSGPTELHGRLHVISNNAVYYTDPSQPGIYNAVADPGYPTGGNGE